MKRVFRLFIVIGFAIMPLLYLALSVTPVQAASNGKIVYMGSDGEIPNIYSMDPDGSNVTQLTDGSFGDAYPSIAPDGSKIAYLHFEDESTIFVSTVNPDGTDNSVTSTSGYYPGWLPNSSKIVYPAPPTFEFYTMNIDESNKIGTGFSPFLEGPIGGRIGFSNDGSKVAFPKQEGEDIKIAVSDIDGSNSSTLTSVLFGVSPQFTPDGNTIYFLGTPDGLNIYVYSVGVDGSNETQHQLLPAGDMHSFTISPDGSKAVYVVAGDITFDIYTMDIDGSNQTLVVNEATGFGESSGIGWAPDSTKLVFSQGPDEQAQDIYTVNADGTNLTNLTNTPGESEAIYFTYQAWGAAPDSGGSEGSGTNSDSDTIPDSIEQAAPNNGDGNNDGTPDSQQSNVTSLPDPKTGKYITLMSPSGTTLTSTSVVAENTPGSTNDDTSFDYPLGLVSFTLDGVTPGSTNDITIYYSNPDNTDPSSYVLRKHNPNTKTTFTIGDTVLSSTTINNIPTIPTITASYQVTDGQDLDIDGEANGTIVDPVGLATTTGDSELSGTGDNTNWVVSLAGVLFISTTIYTRLFVRTDS